MRIAVTDTGRPLKQQLYRDWLQSFAPDAELVNVSYRTGEQDLHGFDGLVLTGGEDIDPLLSKAHPAELVEEIDRKRDDAEFRFLEDAMRQRMPILGICRGLQVTNVFLGGTMIADLPNAGFRPHTAPKDAPVMYHPVLAAERSLLHEITGTMNGTANSYHHQAVKDCAEELIITGRSDDGVAEAMEWKVKEGRSPMLLVQWHPERMMEGNNPFTASVGEFFFREAMKFNSTK